MCSQRSDEEWTCAAPDAQQCSSAARLQIDVRDTSTTITDHSLHPVSPDIFTPGSEAEAQFATMFSGTQHPAISYVTEIIPVGLGNCGGSPPCLDGGECVGMPALDIAPTTEENTQNLLAMFAEKQQPYTRHSVETYRCECPPSWVGVACEESVADLNARRALRGQPPVSIDRFRPNIVLRGCAPLEEDTWCGLTIGAAAAVRISSPCPRCTVPDVDQLTGSVDSPAAGPMTTLRGYRARAGRGVLFGAYASVLTPGAYIRVGAPVQVQHC